MAPLPQTRAISERARPANEHARIAGKIARYRGLLPQFHEDRETMRVLLAEIADLQAQLASFEGDEDRRTDL